MIKIPSHPEAEKIARVLQAGLDAANPVQAVERAVQRRGRKLIFPNREVDLEQFQHIFLVGAGKASVPMTYALVNLLGETLQGGLVITKHAELAKTFPLPSCVRLLEGSHPVPDEKSLSSTLELVNVLRSCGEDDLVLCTISGGGSALMTLPVEGVPLKDIQQLTRLLLAGGATIQEMNTLRKHLDQVKGGGLARLASPAQMITLILSDVVGSPLESIASGPTVADPTTFAEALSILQKYHLTENTPPSILEILHRGERGNIPETLKPGSTVFNRVQNILVADNLQAAHAALQQAQEEGFHALLLTTYLQGEARQAGQMLAGILRQMAVSGEPLPRPACLVVGGETTVTIQGNGLGGRNQELALGAVPGLDGLENAALVTLATDGEDGPTNSAGALVTGATFKQAQLAGLSPFDFLERNDSYHFFASLEALLMPGPTGTNVNDLAFLFTF